jgi:hypothetical protein
MSSLFDPQAFLETEVEGASSTRSSPTPLGRYEMVVAEMPKFKQIIPPAGADYEAFTTMEVECLISGDALDSTGRPVKETTGKDRNFARYSCRIDRTPGGNLDMGQGKNVGLGRLREAVGQNNPSLKWKPSMLINARFSGEVKHKPDKRDASVVYAEVVNPIPLS